MRVDFYTLIHKAQREHLFKLSMRIAKIDFANVAELSKLKNDLKMMINHLREHSEHEEKYIHPFYKNFQKQVEFLEADHSEFEDELSALEQLLNAKDFENKIYSLFNKFLGSYLLHTDQEERIQQEILWSNFSDEELIKGMQAFQQNFSIEDTFEHMKFMLPCLSINEVKMMLEKMKKSGADVLLEKLIQFIKESFSKEDGKKILESGKV